MARDSGSRETRNGGAMQEDIQTAISGLSPAGMQDMLQRIFASREVLDELL